MENSYFNSLGGELSFETSFLENYIGMSHLDLHNTPLEDFKDESEYLYGNMNDQSNYDIQNHSNFSNVMAHNSNQLNYSSDHTLDSFDIDYLDDYSQSHVYPSDQNKPLITHELDSFYSNSSYSMPNCNKSLPLDNNSHMNNIYTANSTIPSPYYDPISTLESPRDQLVPSMATPDYSLLYGTSSSQIGSFMSDTVSPSPSSMTTAQLVTAVYGVASDKQTPQERVPIVWHFLLRLLANPQYNPSIICWDNIGDNTFRLINPDAVASLWGKRLGKPNLTRNNFARTLRYHYSNGALNQMSEQHVYQLGSKALDYLREKACYCK